MAVALSTLAGRLENTLNPPGGGGLFDATEDQYVAALANAFWIGRLSGLFVGYRVDTAGENIVAVDGGDDLGEELHQLVVMFAALTAIEAKLLALLTYMRAKAGPVESEKRRSAEVLTTLLKAKRVELEQIRDDLAGLGSTSIEVIDGVLARTESIGYGEGAFWR